MLVRGISSKRIPHAPYIFRLDPTNVFARQKIHDRICEEFVGDLNAERRPKTIPPEDLVPLFISRPFQPVSASFKLVPDQERDLLLHPPGPHKGQDTKADTTSNSTEL